MRGAVGKFQQVTHFVEKFRELLESDRRYMYEKLAQELGLNNGTVHSIIRNRLGMQNVSACWVPHHLTYDQAQCRLAVTFNLLSRFETEENNFVSRIIAIEEPSVRSYEPEMKRHATE